MSAVKRKLERDPALWRGGRLDCVSESRGGADSLKGRTDIMAHHILVDGKPLCACSMRVRSCTVVCCEHGTLIAAMLAATELVRVLDAKGMSPEIKIAKGECPIYARERAYDEAN